jgi:hypothetical protein
VYGHGHIGPTARPPTGEGGGEGGEGEQGERGGRHTHTQRVPTPPLHTLTCCYPTRLDLYSASALYTLALALSRCDDFWLEAWNYLGLMLRARKRTARPATFPLDPRTAPPRIWRLLSDHMAPHTGTF